jgi:hypothetical protein
VRARAAAAAGGTAAHAAALLYLTSDCICVDLRCLLQCAELRAPSAPPNGPGPERISGLAPPLLHTAGGKGETKTKTKSSLSSHRLATSD